MRWQNGIANIWLFLSVLAIALLDQWSKYAASSLLQYGQPVEVLPVLNWTLLHNHGAAFSFLSDQGGWQRWFFTVVSGVASVGFSIWLWRLPKTAWLLRLSLMFIIAGALGNLYDRVLLGYVVDFISVHWQNQYFYPAFNVADMSITFGAVLMLGDIFVQSSETKASDDKQQQ